MILPSISSVRAYFIGNAFEDTSQMGHLLDCLCASNHLDLRYIAHGRTKKWARYLLALAENWVRRYQTTVYSCPEGYHILHDLRCISNWRIRSDRWLLSCNARNWAHFADQTLTTLLLDPQTSNAMDWIHSMGSCNACTRSIRGGAIQNRAISMSLLWDLWGFL